MADNNPVFSLLPVQTGLLRHLSLSLPDMGLNLDALLEREGYDNRRWLDEQQEVPALLVEKFLDHCLSETGDGLFGFHLAQRVRPEGFGVVGYIRHACRNLQDFILVCIRYEHLISGFGKTRLLKEPGRCIWSWSAQTLNPTFERHATEFTLTVMNTTRSLLEDPQFPWLTEVRFTHSAPQTMAARKEVEAHFGCRVRYNQKHNGLVMFPETLTMPFNSADAALMHSLEQHAQSQESSRTEKGFYYRAYKITREQIISRQASKENLASALGISSRHLHRQLSRENINYRALHEQVMLTLAIEYLSSSDRTIENIAMALGYTESQSFIRWFKKQTGQTPSRYRDISLSRKP
ncbi:AraC family transcriptional regulator [Alcanivorax sp.]|uniref:AraC family transcriptional regulator n=1 Tax=Alcanivorax sp. TaxID=1872427 RepID=UPI000C6927D9|nr:AraC family transcriptional regulator [Alcanivorax sp.]MBU84204.1 hypothetical protein [Alcanivorax sp.]